MNNARRLLSQPVDCEWISGALSYSSPPAGRIIIAPTELQIVPSSTIVNALSVAAVVLVLPAVCSFVWGGKPIDFFDYSRVFIVSAIALVGIVGVGTAAASAIFDYQKGAYLIASRSKRLISLPRHGVEIPWQDAAGWRVVSGNVAGSVDEQKRRAKPMSELQLLVRHGDTLVAYAVIGWIPGVKDVDVECISRETGLLMEVITQRQGLTKLDEPARMKQWRSGNF